MTFETKSSYCRAKVQFNSINWVRHGSSTTFETGLTCLKITRPSRRTIRLCCTLYLSNVMSLAPKIDEIRHVVQYANVDCVCMTESWLRSHIHDNVVALSGFNLVRKDSVDIIHGGVCAYMGDNINFTILEDLENPSFEELWLKLRPACLPRGYSRIVLGIIYHPPNDNDPAILDYLYLAEFVVHWIAFPNCGLLIVGDFNRLNTKRLQNGFDPK